MEAEHGDPGRQPPSLGVGVDAVSVLVPTLRRPDQLRACLEGIRAQRRPPDEIVVVHRPDDEGTLALLGEPAWSDVRPVTVEVPGVVAALEAGAARCRGSIVAITDDDAVPRPGWLEVLLAPFSDPTVGAVGGRDVVHHDDGIEIGAETEVGLVRGSGKVIGHHNVGAGPPRPVDHLKGVNMAFRREVLAFPVGLRGRGAQVFNELATSLFVQDQGRRLIYDPAAVVDHYPGPRFDPDARGGRSDEALYDIVYNGMYVVASMRRHLRNRRLAWALLVGERHGPGVARCIVGLARREQRVVDRWRIAVRANVASWRRARRDPLAMRRAQGR